MFADNPVMLVTGATGGIGSEIAAQASAAGWVVGLHGYNETTIAKLVERLGENSFGARLLPAPADYSYPQQVRDMVSSLVSRTGRLDAVIDCAMVRSKYMFSGPFPSIDPGAFGAPGTGAAELQSLCHAVIPHLARRGGAIVAFSSDSGRFAAPQQSGVAAKQGAVMAFVRNLALEVARDGVRVNCISPSFVENTPVYERFLAEEIGRAGRVERPGLDFPRRSNLLH